MPKMSGSAVHCVADSQAQRTDWLGHTPQRQLSRQVEGRDELRWSQLLCSGCAAGILLLLGLSGGACWAAGQGVCVAPCTTHSWILAKGAAAGKAPGGLVPSRGTH